ncbi:MAG: 16S rRNA (cytidine(1402)-2'-O)-methyltransferase [Candidatus Magasanikbacteria bacterium]|nr:16S rRNA (cytidine(1402)-2'-O)-methyltransferase [Candidatus Magasanikbacteria bacterium]
METKKISFVATPIGNLGDISIRAVETLKLADVILCEDTRVTKKLLHHFEVETPTKSYHQHSSEKKILEILTLLDEGKHIVLVTDAGTPGISDPGNVLVERIVAHDNTIVIEPIPGPSAVISALSVCGFATDSFLFLGFPPHKKKRKQFFEKVEDASYTTVFYESPYRITKALTALAEITSNTRKLCVCREITKKFEQTYRGTAKELLDMNIPEKGEFVVVCEGKK